MGDGGKQAARPHWKSIGGIPLFKLEWCFKYWLYRLFRITLPKLADQRDYWIRRGEAYREEITSSGYLAREAFFQDLFLADLRQMGFESFFEAGSGFGWNIARVKREFPAARVGGLDFSLTQLKQMETFCPDLTLPVVNGAATAMPFADDAFDVGFTLGVFMNIHPDKIRKALSEMLRVSKKYVIHLEYDQTRTTPELKERRAFKTNIVSHDYKALYEELGARVVKLLTYRDFGPAYQAHAAGLTGGVARWEGFEGPEKYMYIVVEAPGR